MIDETKVNPGERRWTRAGRIGQLVEITENLATFRVLDIQQNEIHPFVKFDHFTVKLSDWLELPYYDIEDYPSQKAAIQ